MEFAGILAECCRNVAGIVVLGGNIAGIFAGMLTFSGQNSGKRCACACRRAFRQYSANIPAKLFGGILPEFEGIPAMFGSASGPSGDVIAN